MRITGLIIVLFLFSCSTYDQLKPMPALSNKEAGYQPITDENTNFEVEKDDQYFIQIPPAKTDNTYVVFRHPDKKFIETFFTGAFDDGKPPIQKITNEWVAGDSLEVYELGPKNSPFYYVIDKVVADGQLKLAYRFVPVWRFKFENEFNGIEVAYSAAKLDTAVMDRISDDAKAGNLQVKIDSMLRLDGQMNQLATQLQAISQRVPTDLDSLDPANVRLTALTADIQSERARINTIREALETYQLVDQANRNPDQLIRNSAQLRELTNLKGTLPAGVYTDLTNSVKNAIPKSVTALKAELNAKRTTSAISTDLTQLIATAEALQSGQVDELKSLQTFIRTYNQIQPQVATLKSRYNTVYSRIYQNGLWPPVSFYQQKQSDFTVLQNDIGNLNLTPLRPYRSYPFVTTTLTSVTRLSGSINTAKNQYARATGVVTQIEALRKENDYSTMIGLILKNKDLGFLRSQYSHLDDLSIRTQTAGVRSAITANRFDRAEVGLKSFAEDKNFINFDQVKSLKTLNINSLEKEMFTAIKTRTSTLIDSMITENTQNLNVDPIYASEKMKAAYVLTYSTGGKLIVDERNQELAKFVTQKTAIDFPEKAIDAIYRSFITSPRQSGVLKARAVVAHGTYYNGKSARIWNMVNEMDPYRGKRLDEAATYRKLYALPTNKTPGSSNSYIFKVNMVIPSTSKFPTYEVNIKLPEAVAKNAGNARWFTSIKVNGKRIEPEGPVTIIAPTAANNYIFQITPIQIEKDQNNSFEVQFDHPDFTPFEVSVMAQKPIIRKN